YQSPCTTHLASSGMEIGRSPWKRSFSSRTSPRIVQDSSWSCPSCPFLQTDVLLGEWRPVLLTLPQVKRRTHEDAPLSYGRASGVRDRRLGYASVLASSCLIAAAGTQRRRPGHQP